MLFGLGTEQWAAVLGASEGWGGVMLILVYSVLVAVVLPTPSELVLLVPLLPGAPPEVRWAVIILLGATGKMTGSILAVAISREVPGLINSPTPEWLQGAVKQRISSLVDQYGAAGLALALCVPGVPDTLPIYGFALLGGSYRAYAAATFIGGAGRYLIVLLGVGGVLTII